MGAEKLRLKLCQKKAMPQRAIQFLLDLRGTTAGMFPAPRPVLPANHPPAYGPRMPAVASRSDQRER